MNNHHKILSLTETIYVAVSSFLSISFQKFKKLRERETERERERERGERRERDFQDFYPKQKSNI